MLEIKGRAPSAGVGTIIHFSKLANRSTAFFWCWYRYTMDSSKTMFSATIEQKRQEKPDIVHMFRRFFQTDF